MTFFKQALRTGAPYLFLLLSFATFGCEKYDWYNAVQKNTIPGYEYFMRKHHHSLLLTEANDRLRILHFEQAKKINTIPAYEAFLRFYSWGDVGDSARYRIEKLAFESAKKTNTIPAFKEFLKFYGSASYSSSAYEALDQLYFQRHPDFRNVQTARVKVHQSLGKKGDLNEFINLPFEHMIKEIMTVQGVQVSREEADACDMILAVDVNAGILKTPEIMLKDSLPAYCISFDMQFKAQVQGKEPLIFECVKKYYPEQPGRTTSLASQKLFEQAFWQIGSYPTCLATVLSQCFGPVGMASLLDKDKKMQPHIIRALTTIGEPVSDILYANLTGINEKSMAIASVLTQLGDPRVLPFLVEVLGGENRSLQTEAMKWLKTMPDTSSVTPLIGLTGDRKDRERCLLAIETLGFMQDKSSTDHLIDLLGDRDSQIRETAVLALGKQKNPDIVVPLIKMFADEERQVADQAMTALKQTGKMAIDSLKKALQSAEVGTVWRAMEVLGELRDSTTIDDIIPLLNHSNSFTSWNARRVLGQFKNKKVLRTMINALQDPEMSEKAVAVLGYLGDPEAVWPLINSYKEESSFRTKTEIIRALGELGEKAAVDLLIKILNSDQIVLQTEAARALGKIGDIKALPVLSKWYQEDDLTLKLGILEAYGGYRNPKQTHLLIKALGEGKYELRAKAAEILGETVDESRIRNLIYLLDDPSRVVQDAVRNALRNLGDAAVTTMAGLMHGPLERELKIKIIYALKESKSERAVGSLIRSLSDPDSYITNNVKTALQYIGEPAVRPLLSLIGSGRPEEKKRAAEILSSMREPRSVQEFMNILKGNDTELKKNAAFLVGELQYFTAVSLLIGCLGEQNLTLSIEATIALGKIGSPEATAALLTGLNSKNVKLAVESARALGNIKDPGSITALIENSRSGDKTIKTACSNALAKIGAPAVEPLLLLMTDSNHFVIENTAGILSQIGTPAVPGLLNMINNTSSASWYAVQALGKIDDDRVIQPLIGALSLDDDYFYRNVKNALVNIGQPAVGPVLELLQAEEADLRWKAVEILYAFRKPALTRYFISAMEDRDWRVRFTASRYLENISGEKYGMSARKWQKWYREYKDRWNI